MFYQIYNASGELMAATKYAEDAAAMVAIMGKGATVRALIAGQERVIWREGKEKFSAGESYDGAAEVMKQHIHVHEINRRVKG